MKSITSNTKNLEPGTLELGTNESPKPNGMHALCTRAFSILFSIAILFSFAYPQDEYSPLATMNGRSFTVQDLPFEVSDAWSKLPETLVRAKKDLLELQIDEVLVAQEAIKRSMNSDTLLDLEVTKKVPNPTAKQIQAFYEENKAAIGDVPLADVRDDIIRFMRIELEKNAKEGFVKGLREVAKISYLNDVTAKSGGSNEVLVLVNDEPISYSRFLARNGLPLYEYEANVFDKMKQSLDIIVDSAVYQEEAQARDISVSGLMRVEITDKMTEVTSAEQQRLESALKAKLFSKYRVKYFVNEPRPFVQKISADDDPFIGKRDATVTIVIFADYECPGCAAFSPLLKKTVEKYGDKVRLVYRDFPLTKIHKQAFGAALAANAASKQGKFFEYGELLYNNQQALSEQDLKKYAVQLKLDVAKFSADMKSAEAESEVRNDMKEGEQYGVSGTPSVFIDGYKLRSLSIPALEAAIEKAIAGEFRIVIN
ncbi:MAG: thioredoxin domain-containing protein [Pyrinomonadaceae bacterium]